MRHTILIAGYFGHGNVGDEAILLAMAERLWQADASLDLQVLTTNPQADWGPLLPAVDWRSPSAVMAALARADLLLIGGGGLFQDYWGTSDAADPLTDSWGMGHYLRLASWAKLAGVPVMTYAVGVGPLQEPQSRASTRRLYDLTDDNTVRDRASLQLLLELGVPAERVHLTADPAVALGAEVKYARQFLAAQKGHGPWLVVSPRLWRETAATTHAHQAMAEALDAFLNAHPEHRVLFVPFHQGQGALEDDLQAIARVRQAMNTGRQVVLFPPEEVTPARVAGLFAAADLALTMRLHGAIFATSQGTPFVALAYDPKVAAFAAEVGLPEQAMSLTADAQTLTEALQRTWENRATLQAHLREAAAALKKREEENTRRALALLESPRPAAAAWPAVQPLAWEHIRRLFAWREQAQKDLARLREVVAQAEEKLAQSQQHTAALEEKLTALQKHYDYLWWFYHEVTGSRAWRLVQTLWRWRARLLPAGSWRARLLRGLYRGARLLFHPRRLATRLWQPLLRPRGPFAQNYTWEDHTQVVLYTDQRDFWPEYRPRKPLREAPSPADLRVSLIMPVLNEKDTLHKTLAALTQQTRLPDELVVVDTGSTDGTVEALQAFAQQAPFPVKVIERPGSNIAQARNTAVQAATHPILAATDFGCYPHPRWLENLLKPFADRAEVLVAGGIYRPVDEQGRPSPTAPLWAWAHPEWLYPPLYLPPGVSVAFRREAWEAVGGFPEWTSLTGEDTLFDIALKQHGGTWAFVPDAVVDWVAPKSLIAYAKKMYRWSTGDGESGVNAAAYWKRLLLSLAATAALLGGAVGLGLAAWPGFPGWVRGGLVGVALALWAAMLWQYRKEGFSIRWFFYNLIGGWAKVLGFLKGARSREQAYDRRWAHVRGLLLSLAPVPLDDTGGGSRFAQLALAFARAQWRVVYLNRYPKYESIDLHLQIGHPNLTTQAFAEFSWQRFQDENEALLKRKRAMILLEFPHPDFLPVLHAARDANFLTAYDVVDAWDTALGGDWYRPEAEREIIDHSDVLFATAHPLVEHIHKLSGRNAVLVPNAVNRQIFDPSRPWERPADLPQAAWIALYIGALWGNWFDWHLVQQLAARHPRAAVVLIGDYQGQSPLALPENVHFLGLKPQHSLPAYLTHADVAIVPWKINDITRATSPLKVYEYLAMHRPVVAPEIPPLADVPGVWRYRTAEAFLAQVDAARQAVFPHEAVEAFIQQHTWDQRVQEIMQALQALGLWREEDKTNP